MATFMRLSTTPRSPLCRPPIAGLLLYLFFALSPSTVSSGPLTASSNDCAALTTPGDTVTTILKTGTETLRLTFPRPYLVPLAFRDGATRDAVTFAINANSYLPLGDGESRAAVDAAPLKDTVLLMATLIRSDLRQSALEEFAKLQAMVHHPDTVVSLAPISVPGLVSPKQDSVSSKELFFQFEGTALRGVISCSKVEAVKFPHCKHVTVVGPLLLDIGYSRSLLPQWRQISKHSERLAQCFMST